MRIFIAFFACSFLVTIVHAELQNVQVGSTLRIRAGVPLYSPGTLSIPTFYESFLSAAAADETNNPLSATFGDVSIKIGLKEQEAIDLLSTKFTVLEMEPDRALPTTRDYQIIGEIEGSRDTYRGALLVETGKVVRITTNLGRFDESDAGSIMTAIINALEAAKNEDQVNPQVDSDIGMRDGKKARNGELKFEFEHMTIAVVHYDSDGASQRVSVSRSIGTRRWRDFPRASDFKDE